MKSQRRYERVPFIRDARMSDGSAKFAVTTTDLSEGGCGIFSSRPLTIGDAVTIEITTNDAGSHEPVSAVVRFVRAEIEGNRIGLEFASPIRRETHPTLADSLRVALTRATRIES